VTWEAVREVNCTTNPIEKRGLLDLPLGFDRVLGLRLSDAVNVDGEALPAEVAVLVQQREEARAARDWATADALRDAVRERGYEMEDTPSGTRWRKAADGS
jgi:cysteinyl-tRNA synthetase